MSFDVSRMPPDRAMQILRVSAAFAIVALLLMLWSLVDPRPAPVLIALSIGQALGTASFVAYITVVAWDLRRRRRTSLLGSSASLPPPSGSLFGSGTSLPPPSERRDGSSKQD